MYGPRGRFYGRRMLGSRLRRVVALWLFAVLLIVGAPSQAGAADPARIAGLLDKELASVDTYWHETQAAAGRPAPSVKHVWVVPGGRVATGCGVQANDNAAFYCPTDDTIYVAQAFAGALSDGVLAGLPGQQAGFGRAAGDFAVAYVVAHEYAHNVQQEDGTFASGTRALPTELNADCLAGTWVRWAYGKGELDSAGIQQALDAALAVGDFDLLSPQHHGTPQERRDAVLSGVDSGSPAACGTYLQR
jgi:predicted metalloprotease